MVKLYAELFRNYFAGKWALVPLALVAAIGLTTTLSARGGTTEKPASQAAKPQLIKEKQTTLGLYVTAQEAYEMWKAEPEQVKMLDVRTPEEYLFVGHAEMARNIPFAFVKYQWNADKNEPVMEPNPDFISSVKRLFSATDKLLVMCRSGGRSAQAVNALAKAGFKNVYNIIDGMEGDKVNDPESVYNGKRMKNGWKNSGSPSTYDVNPELIWISTRQ
jgi:rhodanese-related sulfurtransferase